MTIPFSPARDQLGHTAPLSEILEIPLLGVPVRYRSNSPAVIAAAARAFAPWSRLPAALVEPGPPLAVDIVVHEVGVADPPVGQAERFVYRAHGGTLIAAAGGSLLTARMEQGSALAFVTPELAADEATLRASVIEGLGLLLVNYRDRTPIHAAGVVHDGRAALLLGSSGAGKSTLCYACVREGFALLAEDTVCVSLARGLRVWGHPGLIHLAPDAPRLFPELARLEPRMRANGKRKLAVDPAAFGAEPATHAERALICLIERAPGQASRIASLPGAELAELIAGRQEAGFDLLGGRAQAAAAALAASPAYRLSVGTDPSTAAMLLRHLIEG
jgi:hypothetical protein